MRSLKMVSVSLLSLAFIFVFAPLAHSQNSEPHGRHQHFTKRQEKKREKELMKELGNPYRQWLNQVSYIIAPAERKAFLKLQTNEEREKFIQAFWARRNPDPGSAVNTYKEQFYRRIAYANEHFSSGEPGWKTDRGRIYIMWGPPSEIDAHPSGGPYTRPESEGGGSTTTYPFSIWTYNYLPGIGSNIKLMFVDPTMTGEYQLTMNPCANDAMHFVPGAGLSESEQMNGGSKLDQFQNTGGTTCPAAIGGMPENMNEFNRIELYAKIFQPPPVKYRDLEALVSSHVIRNQLSYAYRADFLRITKATDLVPVTVEVPDKQMSFKDKGGVQTAKLHIFGRVTTLGGQVAQTFEDPVTVQIPNSLLQQSIHDNDKAIYQKEIPLRPGLYQLSLVVKDMNSGNIGVVNTRLPVPQYNNSKLSSSTLIIADQIEGVSANDIGLGQFVIGDVKVRPDLSAAFRNDQTMGIYMQVYNLHMDPKTHRSNATVRYLITRGKQVVLKQTQTSAQLGNVGEQLDIEKKLPLAGLAPGHYKLQITIVDNTTHQQLVRSADFTVRPTQRVDVSEVQK